MFLNSLDCNPIILNIVGCKLFIVKPLQVKLLWMSCLYRTTSWIGFRTESLLNSTIYLDLPTNPIILNIIGCKLFIVKPFRVKLLWTSCLCQTTSWIGSRPESLLSSSIYLGFHWPITASPSLRTTHSPASIGYDYL